MIFLKTLDGIAAGLRRMGLSSLTRLGRRIFKRCLGRLPLSVTVRGFRIYGELEHRGFLRILEEDRCEPHSVALFEAALKPGMTVVDVGAYVGYYTLVASRAVGSQGRVYAFEPAPLNLPALIRNLDVNFCAQNCAVIQKAASDEARKVPMFVFPGDPSQNSLARLVPDATESPINVECVTIDSVLAGRPAHAVKIDIEGFEPRAIKGMERTIRNSPGMTLIVEFCPAALRAAGTPPDAFLAQLRSCGFDIQVIDEDERLLSSPGPDLFGVQKKNLYCRLRP